MFLPPHQQQQWDDLAEVKFERGVGDHFTHLRKNVNKWLIFHPLKHNPIDIIKILALNSLKLLTFIFVATDNWIEVMYQKGSFLV